MEKVISKLKNIRKRKYLTQKYKSKFAFIGIGNHSINNLYPIIDYFRLELKYIVTKSKTNADLINDNYSHTIGTNELDSVLKDSEINGVFICANPKAHFQLVKKCLLANKNVFIEKPPCLSISELLELIAIEKKSEGNCIVGLQKLYSPLNIELKKHIKKDCFYNYRYICGSYPEGDPIMDLFIHPISLIHFLFGSSEDIIISKHTMAKNVTYFLQITHKNNIKGSIELSSSYSWFNAEEDLLLNTKDGIYKSHNSEELSFTKKQATIANIPLEKIIKPKQEIKILFHRNNNIPIIKNNQLYSNGYYTEIEEFVKICENQRANNNSSLESCLTTYETLLKLNKK